MKWFGSRNGRFVHYLDQGKFKTTTLAPFAYLRYLLI